MRDMNLDREAFMSKEEDPKKSKSRSGRRRETKEPTPEALERINRLISRKTYHILLKSAQGMFGSADSDHYVYVALCHAAVALDEEKYDPVYISKHNRSQPQDPVRHFNAWLRPVAARKLIDELRRLKARKKAEEKAEIERATTRGKQNEDTGETEILRREEQERVEELAEASREIAEFIEPEKMKLVFKRFMELSVENNQEKYDAIIEREFHESHGVNKGNARILVMRAKQKVRACFKRFSHTPDEMKFIVAMRYATASEELLEHPQTLCERIAAEARQRIEFVPTLRDVIFEFLNPTPKTFNTHVITRILNKIDSLVDADESSARSDPRSDRP